MVNNLDYLIELCAEVSKDLIKAKEFSDAKMDAKVLVNLEIAEADTKKLLAFMQSTLKEKRN